MLEETFLGYALVSLLDESIMLLRHVPKGWKCLFLRPVEKLTGNSRILIPIAIVCGAASSLHMIASATAPSYGQAMSSPTVIYAV
jgi:hypothetical protein